MICVHAITSISYHASLRKSSRARDQQQPWSWDQIPIITTINIEDKDFGVHQSKRSLGNVETLYVAVH